MSKKPSFNKLFEKYWDKAIIGIIVGLIVRYGMQIENNFLAAVYIFLSAIILVGVYSFCVWLFDDLNYKKKIIISFFKKYWKHTILILTGGWIYSYIHEIIHALIAKRFGYDSIIDFWSLLPRVRIQGLIENPPSLNQAFLISMAPYILSIIFLLILIILVLLIKKKFIFYLSIIPFLDMSANLVGMLLALITGAPNDFLIVFALGFNWQPLLIIGMILALFGILLPKSK